MRTLFRIVVPASAPMIFVASLMSLIRSFESFEVELVLGTPFRFSVYSTKIYSLIHQTPVNYGGATALSLFILMRHPAVGHSPTMGHQPGALHDVNLRLQANTFSVGQVALADRFGGIFGCGSGNDHSFDLLGMGSLMNLFGHFELERVWTLRHWGTVFRDPGVFERFEEYLDFRFRNDGPVGYPVRVLGLRHCANSNYFCPLGLRSGNLAPFHDSGHHPRARLYVFFAPDAFLCSSCTAAKFFWC